MYDQAQKAMANTLNEQTAIQNIKERIQQLNDRQTKIILSIGDKLHDLLNKRVPQDETNKSGIEAPIGDFNQFLHNEFDKINRNTNRLEDIYNHLQSII